MGIRQHLAFLDATRATCTHELRRIQEANRELQPLDERLFKERRVRALELQVFTTGRELATAAEHLAQTITSTIDKLDHTPVFGLAAWSVRHELRKHLRQRTRARHDTERILTEVQRAANL
ncbi:hypothetical protein ACGFIF_25660 [Kribbella sp. NPDC049174]|uniref:hypothetical protein n=1 Tax=Kribbella sp. NPDC049174 TaxID=3364112 RepID=UPI0037137551